MPEGLSKAVHNKEEGKIEEWNGEDKMGHMEDLSNEL